MSWYTILLGVFFTLFTTFWCCIRPDFPSPHDSKLRTLSTKFNIIFWVLIFPEGVLFWSIRQWFEAGNIPKHILQTHSWTRRHGLFFLMGGFILCHKDGKPFKTLSLRHFEDLVRQKVIDPPLLTSFEIQERSNLHPIFALLAFLQGAWFLAQCIYRLNYSNSTGQGLPIITQLEAITAVLVIISWCIFFFAWKKPLDPQCPILIKPNLQPSTLNNRNIGYRYVYEWEQNRSQVSERRFQLERPNPRSSSVFKVTPSFLTSIAIWPFRSVLNDIIRLFPPIYSLTEFPDDTLKIPLFYVEITSLSIRSVPLAAILSMGTSVVSFLFILRSDAASYYPSPTVYLVWRIASITTTSISGFILCLVALLQVFDFLQSFIDPGKTAWINCLDQLFSGCFAIFLVTLVVGIVPFLVARVVLLVASLVCLKSVSGDAFVGQRSWTDYIPHFP